MSELEELTADILGVSARAFEIRAMIEEARRSKEPVSLIGEKGTGKQLVARCIHERSPRRVAPFLMIDCSLYYERELQRELFGAPGGSSGKPDRKGLLEFADGGSCYLTHIEELTPPLQYALRDYLAEGRFRRFGDGAPIRSEARVITASDRNLDGFVSGGLFDGELHGLLAAHRFEMPPLRERQDDIPHIVEALTREYAGRRGALPATAFSPQAMEALQAYPWPDNLDELKQEVIRLLERGGESVGPESLRMEIANYWFGQKGDPEIRRAIEEIDGHIREFRVMGRLNREFGPITESVFGEESASRDCYRMMIDGH